MCVTKGRNHWKGSMLFPRKHCVPNRCNVVLERDICTKKKGKRTTTMTQQTFTKRK